MTYGVPCGMKGGTLSTLYVSRLDKMSCQSITVIRKESDCELLILHVCTDIDVSCLIFHYSWNKRHTCLKPEEF